MIMNDWGHPPFWNTHMAMGVKAQTAFFWAESIMSHMLDRKVIAVQAQRHQRQAVCAFHTWSAKGMSYCGGHGDRLNGMLGAGWAGVRLSFHTFLESIGCLGPKFQWESKGFWSVSFGAFGCIWIIVIPVIKISSYTDHPSSRPGGFVLALLSKRAFFIDSQRPVPLSLARLSQGSELQVAFVDVLYGFVWK